MIWSRRAAAYSNSIMRAALRICFSSLAMASSRSRLVIFTPPSRMTWAASRLISMSSRTSLTMVFGTMPWASL